MGVQKYIPIIDLDSTNQVTWQSSGLKKMINQKKRLWYSIICKRYHSTNHNQMVNDYKLLKKNVRTKFKKELREYEWKIALNSKLHPKMLYRYVNEK
jgi:c-di-AMP phosphodiesterase-like protein